MVISLIGDTDKRPFLYTLLKICQFLGDVLLVTNDRHLARLIEDEEDDVEVIAGHFQNTLVVVTDATPDDARILVGYNNEDYEYIIYDNTLDADGDLILYIAGCEMSERERDMLEYLEEGTDYHTIPFGFGKKNNIPYNGKMFYNCEIVEGKKVLIQIDSKISAALIKLLSPLLNIPEKTLSKAVMGK